VFDVFDKDKDNYLNLNEFATGMLKLFNRNYDSLINFIFDFYDMDNDSFIVRKDVKLIVEHIPLLDPKNKKPTIKDKEKIEKIAK